MSDSDSIRLNLEIFAGNATEEDIDRMTYQLSEVIYG
jgi:hypothetical protein